MFAGLISNEDLLCSIRWLKKCFFLGRENPSAAKRNDGNLSPQIVRGRCRLAGKLILIHRLTSKLSRLPPLDLRKPNQLFQAEVSSRSFQRRLQIQIREISRLIHRRAAKAVRHRCKQPAVAHFYLNLAAIPQKLFVQLPLRLSISRRPIHLCRQNPYHKIGILLYGDHLHDRSKDYIPRNDKKPRRVPYSRPHLVRYKRFPLLYKTELFTYLT